MFAVQKARNFGRKGAGFVALMWTVAAALACMSGQKEYIAGHGRPTSSLSPRTVSSVRMMAADSGDPRYSNSNYRPSGSQYMSSNSGAIGGILASIVAVGTLSIGLGVTKMEAPPPSSINPQGSFRAVTQPLQPLTDELQKQADHAIENMSANAAHVNENISAGRAPLAK